MDNVSSSDITKQGASWVDKSADKIHGGIRDAQQSAKDADATIAKKVDDLGTKAKQGIESVKDSIRQTRESVSESSEALITYTKENPVKALMIAAASGALLWTLLKAVAPSRD